MYRRATISATALAAVLLLTGCAGAKESTYTVDAIVEEWESVTNQECNPEKPEVKSPYTSEQVGCAGSTSWVSTYPDEQSVQEQVESTRKMIEALGTKGSMLVGSNWSVTTHSRYIEELQEAVGGEIVRFGQ